MDTIALLKHLSEINGVSGYEIEVREFVSQEFTRYADEVRTDALGNVIAVKRGSGAEPRPAVKRASDVGRAVRFVSSRRWVRPIFRSSEGSFRGERRFWRSAKWLRDAHLERQDGCSLARDAYLMRIFDR